MFVKIFNGEGDEVGKVWQEPAENLPTRYKVFTYVEFLDILEAKDVAVKLRRQLKKDTDVAADVENLYEYGRATGVMDFNDRKLRRAINALPNAVITRALKKEILGEL
jgi:hypothetical protein